MVQENSTSEHQDIVWTPIAAFTRESRRVNVRFKVLSKREPRIVTQKRIGRKYEVSDCIVGDSTGVINLTLWNGEIDDLEEGQTYELRDGYISLYDECMILSKGKIGTFTESTELLFEIDEQTDMSRPFMGKPKRRKRERSPTGRSFSGVVGRETKGFCSRKSF